jgi:class 3 adenylate cyclase
VEAERRQVTVLFTDVAGFTTFSERAGEEAAFTLMQSLAKLMEDAVNEQGGVVQGFTGDGVMAVFGAPVALEDAPLRACRAALAILERLKAATGGLEAKHGVRPQLRIGVNTGLAVLGQVQGGASAGVTVLGDTVNVAARLQAIADPGAVVMSEAMHRLLEGLVEASFIGEHQFKGKAEPQKVYQLVSIREGATRFGAAVSRGLSAYVGRERELDVLERALAEAHRQLRVIDVMAEPGMGKSRLLHEFRQRLGPEQAFILTGNCSSDGQQTPFLPFIEVVRGSFQVSAGEAEKEIARKLEMGLTVLGLHSQENLGLLLNLLGLKPPEEALAGLDGVLIGLRTRDLLQLLLDARCRLSPVVLLIEDLHWIDSVSEEVLGRIVDGGTKLRLLLLHTRRPEYQPAWLDRSVVIKLHLEPLAAGDIRRLVQTRLGAEVLPEALARQVTEKAEGNALFAEEIVSFLTERGVLRAAAGKVEFDARVVAAALPASVESLLTARVDRLAAQDRVLLQAAAVIGRRFDPQLLAATARYSGDIDARLAAMQALDLVHPEGKTGDYVFKHALVRDALYLSLLTGPRVALHLKIAEEIERRSGNRLAEVVEALAHHYSQTEHMGKAFTFLFMAGEKSLSVYSIDEATAYYAAAVTLLDKDANCASDEQVTEFLASYMLLLNLSGQIKVTIGVVERYLTRIERQGDSPRALIIRYHYAHALLLNARYREAEAMQSEAASLADRLGDGRSKAYAFAGDTFVGALVGLKPIQNFERLRRESVKAAADTQDVYLQNQVRAAPGFEEMVRGRMNDARESARELLEFGRVLNDPRSTGFGLYLLAYIAFFSDSYAEALEYSEQSLAVVVTPVDRLIALGAKAFALALLGRIDEGVALLEEYRRGCVAHGYLYGSAAGEVPFGVCKIFQGDITEGLYLIEQAILKRDKEGLPDLADLFRLNLAEVYLQIIAGKEKPTLSALLKNLPILLKVIVSGSGRIHALMTHVLRNPHFDPDGHHVGRAQMILGLLYKVKKKRALAVQHLTEAKRIASQFGPTPMLAKIEAALAEFV